MTVAMLGKQCYVIKALREIIVITVYSSVRKLRFIFRVTDFYSAVKMLE